MKKIIKLLIILQLILLMMITASADTLSIIGPSSATLLSCKNEGRVYKKTGDEWNIQSFAMASSSATEAVCRTRASVVFAGTVYYSSPINAVNGNSVLYNKQVTSATSGTYFTVESTNWFWNGEYFPEEGGELGKQDVTFFMNHYLHDVAFDGIYYLQEPMYLIDGFNSESRSISYSSPLKDPQLIEDMAKVKMINKSKLKETRDINKLELNSLFSNEVNLYHYFERDNLVNEFSNIDKAQSLIKIIPIHYLGYVVNNEDTPPVIWIDGSENTAFYSIIRKDGSCEVYKSTWSNMSKCWSNFERQR